MFQAQSWEEVQTLRQSFWVGGVLSSGGKKEVLRDITCKGQSLAHIRDVMGDYAAGVVS